MPSHRGWRLAVGLLVVASTACGASDTPSATTLPAGTGAPEETTTTTRPVSPLPQAGGPLEPEGRYHAFLDEVTGSRAVVDVAEMLTGEAARQAAVEDGELPEGQELPNDFYVRNRSEEVRTLELLPEVAVTLLVCRTECEIVGAGVDVLSRLLDGGFTAGEYYGGPHSLFTIELAGGRVARIDEVYLP